MVVGEMGVGEMVVGEMGVGEMALTRLQDHYAFLAPDSRLTKVRPSAPIPR